ncbi:MAG: hypothetical protein ABW003_04995 [Microvirga sp.]
MPSINAISIDKLAHPVGTPKCPVLIDVQTDEDFAANPRLIPRSIRRPWSRDPEWAKELTGRSTIVICQKGLKLSQGVAGWFAIHTVFRETWPVRGFGLSFDAPALASVDPWALLLSAVAMIAMFRFKVGMIPTLAAYSAAGILLYLLGAIA